MEDLFDKIVDDYYENCPCIDTNSSSTETYDNNDNEHKKIEGWLLFYNMI